jgi:hypothetical protein
LIHAANGLAGETRFDKFQNPRERQKIPKQFGEVVPQPRQASANARRIALRALWSLAAVISPCFVAADVRRLKIICRDKLEPRHLGCHGSESRAGRAGGRAHELEIFFSHGLNTEETRGSINQN